jgi:hypothetical protein
MQSRGTVSLVSTVLLCIPSLVGAGSLVMNELIQRHIEEWGIVSSVSVASAVFFGWPLVTAAAIVGGWLVCVIASRRE